MARTNGQNGQTPPPAQPQDAVPHWRHPSDPGHTLPPQPQFNPPHGHVQVPQSQQGFAPSPDLPPYGQQPPPYGQPSLANFAPHGQPPAQPQQPPQPYPQHAPQQPSWATPAHTHDPQAYDLNHYGHGSQPQPPFAPQHPPQAQPPMLHDPYARIGGQPPPPWPAPPAGGVHPHQQFDPPFAPQSFAEPTTGQHGQHGQHAYAHQHPGQTAPPSTGGFQPDPRGELQPHAADQYDDEEEYDDEYIEDEPKRGRKLMVVGALVGAICVGGGLAYAYKMFSGGKTPLIASRQAAAKKSTAGAPATAPKVAAKLPEAVPMQAVASSTAVDEGPRRVQTIAVVPPGVSPPESAPQAPMAAPTVMPGMVLENLPRPQAAAPPPPPPPAATLRPSTVVMPAPVQAAPAAQPRMAMVTPATPPAPERRAVPVPKKAPVNDALNPKAPGANGGVTATKSSLGAGSGGANGYVATVLSTQKGRGAAMQAFADLQQKFPDVLSAKPAEVQEKNLGAKGIWYRAVVGPPGSSRAAAEVCTQLKASGYIHCFVSAY